MGRLGSALGAVRPGIVRFHETYTMSSEPRLESTTRLAGRCCSASSPSRPRTGFTTVVRQLSPKSSDWASSMLMLPVRAPPSRSSHPLRAT
jgi:hypothetical protein